MYRHSSIALWGSFFLVTFAAEEIYAYVPSVTTEAHIPIKWMGTNCIVLTPDKNGSDDINDNSVLTAYQNAAATWNSATASCGYMKIQIAAEKPSLSVGFDEKNPSNNENIITFVESNWPHDPAAAGITTVFFNDYPESDIDGRIFDTDVELNGQIFTFGTRGEKQKTDVENTVTHEFGHVLGLDHPCDDGTRDPVPSDHLGNIVPKCFPVTNLPKTTVETTMFNFALVGETQKRTLESDDVLGACSTYPLAENPEVCTPYPVDLPSPGCDLPQSQQQNLQAIPWFSTLYVIALSMALLALRRRWR